MTMTGSAESAGTTPEPTETDAAVTAVIAGWNDEARDERDPRRDGADPALTPPPPAALTVSSNGTTAAASAHPRPTVRWGALVWSLLFGALAGTALWLMLDPDRIDATGAWLATLSPLTAALYALVALGVVLALFGIVGLIRRGERTDR
jgi:hypothetical protein